MSSIFLMIKMSVSPELVSILGGDLLSDLAKIIGAYTRFEGIEAQILQGHNQAFMSLAVLPDGRLASGSNNRTIRIWDLVLGTSQVLEGHTNSVVGLAVLPDGRLVSGSYDKTIRIWDLVLGTSQVLEGHNQAVMSLAVLPDGRLVSGSHDKTIRIWV